MYQDLLVEVRDRVATITINRPQFSNAFGEGTYAEMKAAIEALGADDTVGAIVITGMGKHFSAGGDIKRFKMLIETGTYLQEKNVDMAGKMAAAVRRCPKPVIAMINGAAVGTGCSLALACDFRIMTPKSKLMLSFIKIGLSGDTGCMYYLYKLVGAAKTIELMMTGAPVDGEEAVSLGLATKVVEEDTLSDATYEFATSLANSPLLAIKRQKELISSFFYHNLDQYSLQETDFMVECSKSADFAEAVDSFLEKRSPHFTGK